MIKWTRLLRRQRQMGHQSLRETISRVSGNLRRLVLFAVLQRSLDFDIV